MYSVFVVHFGIVPSSELGTPMSFVFEQRDHAHKKFVEIIESFLTRLDIDKDDFIDDQYINPFIDHMGSHLRIRVYPYDVYFVESQTPSNHRNSM